MTIKLIIESSLYFLALINPASKVLLLSSMDPPYTWMELRALAVQMILGGLGDWLLATMGTASPGI